ncbi:MAG TPA: glycoside hydrolase family 127 protein, partial [Clostridiales bacterium]|nr:glycoside hydrolase family 127 protein [Clostridiales bacterium]
LVEYKKNPFENVDLQGGFFAQRQKINKDITLYAVKSRFEETGRFDAFKCAWEEGMPHKPHIFWDSDIAKWIESAAYILHKEKNAQLESYIDDIVDLIEKNQQQDGYFNTYFIVVEPDNRFSIRDAHELYCAGHLIEAAIAYYKATGKKKFLNLMCKYVDCIERVFVLEKTAEFTTPGHEEIELALVKLYELTREEKYLRLSLYFINARGRKESVETFFLEPLYSQSHEPVRRQKEAVGHCVRACYLYTAMADLARITGDKELKSACEAIFDNIINRRMYITGGIGSTHNGERFTRDWDLPNSLAYAETCAAISLCFFALRMTLLEVNSKYADIVERTLFNSIISGISLDGESFFYENPLVISSVERENSKAGGYKQRFPITGRVKVFECSCCPPNITRLIASLGDYIYSYSEDTLFVHQYFSNKAKILDTEITLSGDYPNNGSLSLELRGAFKRVAMRIPSWCNEYSLFVGGKEYEGEESKGYVYINADKPCCKIEINFEIKPVLLMSNPFVLNNRGKVALMRGPIVYCLEDIDNESSVFNLAVSVPLKASCAYDNAFGAFCCEADGVLIENKALYFRSENVKKKPVKLKFIPYFSFANRGESDMRVWCDIDV